ncbi:MAG: hypothetical protein U0641_02720 [Anaerolineae bacterium]
MGHVPCLARGPRPWRGPSSSPSRPYLGCSWRRRLAAGIEYARLSVRAAASYDKLAHGFRGSATWSASFSGVVSLWSPLYVGILPLILAVYALVRAWRAPDTVFWAALGGVALLLSFGGGAVRLPRVLLARAGFNIFQGQERAAFLVAFALAMLAGAAWPTPGFCGRGEGRKGARREGRRRSSWSRLCGSAVLPFSWLASDRGPCGGGVGGAGAGGGRWPRRAVVPGAGGRVARCVRAARAGVAALAEAAGMVGRAGDRAGRGGPAARRAAALAGGRCRQPTWATRRR